jgi:hypothetical protein
MTRMLRIARTTTEQYTMQARGRARLCYAAATLEQVAATLFRIPFIRSGLTKFLLKTGSAS